MADAAGQHRAGSRLGVGALPGVLTAVTGLAALLAVEALIVVAVYQLGFDFECRRTGAETLCTLVSTAPLRALIVAAALAVIVALRPALRAGVAGALRPALAPGWLALHLAGFLTVLAPRLFLSDSAGSAVLLAGLGLLVLGGLMAAAGAAAALIATLRGQGTTVAVALAAAALAPEIAWVSQTAWLLGPITAVTFHLVVGTLALLGEQTVVDVADADVGVAGFVVSIATQCSGVEGMALITGFAGLYLALMRNELRFPRALVLIPLAMAASWLLNVVRIVTLILIGAHVSPELAVNGFHSHAGWLMFTVVSLTLVAAAHGWPWLRAAGPVAAVAAVRAPLPPLAQDWNAAQILPFTVFMASALIASTFAEQPALWYPARLAAMAAVLWLFRDLYLRLDWRLDPVALAAGAAVGVAWLATAAPSAADAALDARIAQMSGLAFAGWALARIVGTSLAVPLIEELFFRGYLMRRFDTGGMAMRLVALAASVVPFAALHDRWLAAGVAGLVFAAVALRRGRLGDAVIAHAVANALIAFWALVTGGWSAI
jgi:exosortase E/protease (VPEID-CTERM system)